MNNIEILKLTEGFGGEYLTKEIINYCPMCGRKLREENKQ